MAAFGITDKPPVQDNDVFHLMPENVDTVSIFIKAQTQWRVGPGGLTGLDYSVLFRLFDLYDVDDKRKTFEGIQVMEAAVLKLVQGNK